MPGAGSFFRLSVLFCLGLVQQPCRAEGPLPDSGDTRADEMQELISTRVTNTAAWIDSFFSHDNNEHESNATRLSLGLSSFTERGEGTDFQLKNSLRINLPHLEDRLRLSVSGSTRDLDTTDSSWEDIEQDIRGTNNSNLGATLTYFLRQDDRRNLSLSAGIRLRDGGVAFYVQPRYRHTWHLRDWDLRFVQRVSRYTDTGWDARSELQLERLLRSDWLFRTTALVNWYEEEDGVFPQFGLSWNRRLDERRALAIRWFNFFETHPNTVLESSILRLWYRQQIWRRWLWISVAPQLLFPRSEDYATVPGIMFEVEARFQARP